MIRRPLAAAALGLAVAVTAVTGASPGVGAQSTAGCPAVDQRDEMSIQVGSPTPNETRSSASVPIEVQVTNTSTRKPLPTDPDPRITRVRLTLLSCRDGQVLPEEVTRSSTGDPARTISLSWTPDPIPTNGPFAIEILAAGNRQGNPAQTSRVVVPFALAVAPKRPTGVKAAPTDAGATVSWSNAEREPDLRFYEVQRAAQGSGSYATIEGGIVKANVATVADRPGTGAWRYRVLAIRAGAAEDEGIRSLPSNDATVEVAAPPPPDDGTSSAPSDTRSGTGSSSDGGTTTGASGTRSGATSSTASGGTVNLSGFSAALDARRRVTATPTGPRPLAPDTGFQQTLPFAPRTAPPTVPEAVEEPELPQELEPVPEEALGERLISNDDERRRSMGFIAGGFLLFVLSMTGLFLKGEVRRADELEALGLVPLDTVDPDDRDATANAGAVAAAAAAAAPVEARRARRRRGAGAPVAAAPVGEARRARRRRGAGAPVAAAAAPVEARRARRRREAGAAAAAAPVGEARRARRRREEVAAMALVRQLAAEEPAVTGLAPTAEATRRARRRERPAGATPPATDGSVGRGPGVHAGGDFDDDQGFHDLAEPAPAAPLPPRRVRRTMPPLDAPTLDVAEPAVAPASGNQTRTRTTSAHARRTPPRLPSRPADDRREGGAAVRPRRRRTGEGDRRLPVG